MARDGASSTKDASGTASDARVCHPASSSPQRLDANGPSTSPSSFSSGKHLGHAQ